MASKTIYPQGIAEINVPASQSIAITNYGGGIAKIYYLIKDANRPDAYQFQQSLNDSSVTLGAFSVATTVKIEAGNSKVFYDVGSSPDTGIGDADTLNGKAGDTGDTADTIAARDGSGDLTANAFESTVTTGTAPLTVASTTVVNNLNADSVDGFAASQFLRSDASDSTSGDLGIGVSPTKPLHIKTDNAADKITALFEAQGLTGDPAIAFLITGTEQYVIGIDADDNKFKIGDGASVDANTVMTIDRPNGLMSISLLPSYAQPAESAKTTDATLTTAELKTRIITVNNGAAGTTTLTLPLATGMDSDFAIVGNNYDIEFTVINISTVAGEDCTIATNTGWTLVGEMTIEANDSDRANSSGSFRARKTGAGAWTLYRTA